MFLVGMKWKYWPEMGEEQKESFIYYARKFFRKTNISYSLIRIPWFPFYTLLKH